MLAKSKRNVIINSIQTFVYAVQIYFILGKVDLMKNFCQKENNNG